MNISTRIEFLIHTKSYRNVDFLSFQEGLYHLRFSIFSKDEKDIKV